MFRNLISEKFFSYIQKNAKENFDVSASTNDEHSTDSDVSIMFSKNGAILSDMLEYHNKKNTNSSIEEYTSNGSDKTLTFNYDDGNSQRTYKNGMLDSVTNFDFDKNVVSKTFYENGKTLSDVEYNDDETKTVYRYDDLGKNKTKRINIDENGYIAEVWEYNFATSEWETAKADTEDCDMSTRIIQEDLNNKDIFMIKSLEGNKHELTKPDEKSGSVILTDCEYDKLNKSGLLQCKQFTPTEIKSLLQLDENDFKSAIQFISSRDGIEYKFVDRYLNA